MAELPLPRRGTLVSWTTQEFPPSFDYMGGGSFEPFGIGLVQLGDVVRVESRLTECDPQKLDFGMDVALRIVPFYVDKDGDEVITFAFAPVGAQNSEER
jgi:uncharacterized OB-fold protein